MENELKNSELNIIIRKLARTYPEIYSGLRDTLEKPVLTDFSEIPHIIRFIEIEESLEDFSFMFLPFSERNEFIYLALAVIVVLFDPMLLKRGKKLLVRGLRDFLSKIFRLQPSSISIRLSVMKNELEFSPFFSQRVYKLAAKYQQYRIEKQSTKNPIND